MNTEDAYDLPAKTSAADRRGLELFGLKEGFWIIPVIGVLLSVLLFLLVMLGGGARTLLGLGLVFCLIPAVAAIGYSFAFFRRELPPGFHQDFWRGLLRRQCEADPRPRREAMRRRHPRRHFTPPKNGLLARLTRRILPR